CLGQLVPRAVVGEHPVAARLLDRGRERPRPGHLHLERPRDPLRLLLHGVEVLGEQRARPALVDASRVREPPARGLEVGTEVGDQPEGAARGVRDGTAAGGLGHARPGVRAEHDPRRLGVGAGVVLLLAHPATGHRADARGVGHATALALVAEPTTRVPSYTTTACPGAMPVARSSRRTSTFSPVGSAETTVTTARCSSPWARSCTAHSSARSGAVPHHTGRIAVRCSTASASRGPTVTVPDTGSMSST